MRHVQILTGVRRCGKSTVFKLLINDLLQSGADDKSILVLNLDDPQFIPFGDDSTKLYSIVENAERLTGVKVKYLFLDELHRLQRHPRYPPVLSACQLPDAKRGLPLLHASRRQGAEKQ